MALGIPSDVRDVVARVCARPEVLDACRRRDLGTVIAVEHFGLFWLYKIILQCIRPLYKSHLALVDLFHFLIDAHFKQSALRPRLEASRV